MKRGLAIIFALVFCLPILHAEGAEESVEVGEPHGIVALGKYNKPKHSKYELGSIGGMRFVHDKIYQKGQSSSSGYRRRARESVTGLWMTIKAFPPITLDTQLAYTYDTYKYDRAVDQAHARFHGYSVNGIVEARYRPFDAKLFKISPIVGFGYKYSHKRAYTEKYAPVNNRKYEKSDYKTFQLRLGAFLERKYKIFSRKCWVYSKLMYTRTLHDSDSASKYSVNGGNTQVERSNFQKKDGFELDIGTAINVFRRWDVDVSYQLLADGKLSSHGVLWKVSYNF